MAFYPWICLVLIYSIKNPRVRASIPTLENPIFQRILTLYLSTLDIKTTVSTWHELMELMLFEPVGRRKHIHGTFCTIGRREHIHQHHKADPDKYGSMKTLNIHGILE